MTWATHDPLPEAVTPALLSTAIASASAEVQPHDDLTWDLFEERCEQWFAVQGIVPTPSAAVVFEFWRAELADLPGDLLLLALRRVIQAHRWPKVPAVADFRRMVESDMRERHDRLGKLTTARTLLRPGRQAEKACGTVRPETMQRLDEARRQLLHAVQRQDDTPPARRQLRREDAGDGIVISESAKAAWLEELAAVTKRDEAQAQGG